MNEQEPTPRRSIFKRQVPGPWRSIFKWIGLYLLAQVPGPFLVGFFGLPGYLEALSSFATFGGMIVVHKINIRRRSKGRDGNDGKENARGAAVPRGHRASL